MSGEPFPRSAGAGYLLVAAASILFSAKSVFIKMAYDDGVQPMVLMTLRMLYSLPFFVFMAAYPWIFQRGAPATRLGRRELMAVAGLGLLGFYLSSMLDVTGLQYVSAGLERLILYVYPTLVVVLSALFFRKVIGKEFILPLALTYGGIAFSFSSEISGSGGAAMYLGSVLIFLSALTYAVFFIGHGQMVHKVGAQRLNAYAMLFSSVAISIQFLCMHPVSALGAGGDIQWLAFLTAIFSTVLPTMMVSHGIKLIGASRAAVVSSVGPVSTFVLAGWLLGEPTGIYQMAGLGMVVAGGLRLGTAKK